MEITNLYKVPAFITKDGSEIRELLAHRNSAIRNQSLAEARLPAGGATQEHYHPQTEEIYYITHGTGRIRIEGEVRDVRIGDAIAILPGQRHKLWNIGAEPLRLLCCCAPAYEHSDTGPFCWRTARSCCCAPAYEHSDTVVTESLSETRP
jgi:mannose-6-phosphate isomerase-like protein (cupin superfamily)